MKATLQNPSLSNSRYVDDMPSFALEQAMDGVAWFPYSLYDISRFTNGDFIPPVPQMAFSH